MNFLRTFRGRLLLLTLVGFALRVLFLASQPISIDDFMSGITAINYMESGQLGPTMWNHPALRSILIYCSLQLFGAGVIGLKGWGILFGTLSIPLIGGVTRRLTRSEPVALIATLLWTVEPLAIDFSRQAINDIYLAFFPLAAIYMALRYVESQRPLWLVAAGIAFGCGLASKWSVLFQMVVMAGFLFRQMIQEREATDGGHLIRTLFLAAVLVVLPATIYLATYYPWFERGYSVAEWPALQHSMYLETKLHTGYHEDIVGDHLAYEWFVKPGVTFRDIFHLVDPRSGTGGPGDPTMGMVLLLALANPLVWLLVLPALVLTIRRWLKARDTGVGLVIALFLASYLPLVAVNRPIWVNTALAVLPYAFMLVACALWQLFGEGRSRRKLLFGYLVVVLLLAIPQYLFVTGKGYRIPVVGGYYYNYFKHEPHYSKDPFLPPVDREKTPGL
jgi:dolichyl-phosphate-mannose--protein O-mannosyl transferase